MAGTGAAATGWIRAAERGPVAPTSRDVTVEYLGPSGLEPLNTPGYGGLDPQAFLAEIGAEREGFQTHFHLVDQFQIFVQGGGRLRRDTVRPGFVHYADALAPYGPFSPGPHGAGYLTLRARSDTARYHMPQEREALASHLAGATRPADHRRNLGWDVGDVCGPEVVSPLHVDEDELVVSVVALRPDELAPPLPIGGDGAFLIVLDGSMKAGDASVAPGSVAWQPSGSQVSDLRAGVEGGRCALLQFPTYYRSSD